MSSIKHNHSLTQGQTVILVCFLKTIQHVLLDSVELEQYIMAICHPANPGNECAMRWTLSQDAAGMQPGTISTVSGKNALQKPENGVKFLNQRCGVRMKGHAGSWLVWVMLLETGFLNSLWLRDFLWWHRSGSAWTPRHYLNPCWLIVKGVLWHAPKSYINTKCSWT